MKKWLLLVERIVAAGTKRQEIAGLPEHNAKYDRRYDAGGGRRLGDGITKSLPRSHLWRAAPTKRHVYGSNIEAESPVGWACC